MTYITLTSKDLKLIKTLVLTQPDTEVRKKKEKRKKIWPSTHTQ
jgi:hypothetical protein